MSTNDVNDPMANEHPARPEHPRRLWIVEDDATAGFVVRDAAVEPVAPERPPMLFTAYRLLEGSGEWTRVTVGVNAFRTKVEALNRAISQADDEEYAWHKRRKALEDLLGDAEEEAADALDEAEDERTP